MSEEAQELQGFSAEPAANLQSNDDQAAVLSAQELSEGLMPPARDGSSNTRPELDICAWVVGPGLVKCLRNLVF